MAKIAYKYKSMECYSNMTCEYKDAFDSLAEYYGSMLNEGNPIRNIYFTNHNFDDHCCNMYKIISEVILSKELSYDVKFGLSTEELYLLNVAVLFHDYSMRVLNSSRDSHSTESGDFLNNEIQTETVLQREGKLDQVQIDILSSIIEYHSDSAVKNDFLQLDFEANGYGIVRSKLLAAILRFADELDITVTRIGTQIQYKKLDTTIPEQNNSLKHWILLELFKSVFSKKDGVIYIETNDKRIAKEKNENLKQTLLDILKKMEKLKSEFVLFKSTINEYESAKSFIRLEGIELMSEKYSTNIEDLITNTVSDIETTPSIEIKKVVEETINNDINVPLLLHTQPKLIDSSFSEKMYKKINEDKLNKTGHFLMNKNYCARDWIDTRFLIEDDDFCKDMLDVMCKHITNSSYDKDAIILGIGYEGVIMASKIGFILGRKFSFVIPTINHCHIDKHEVDLLDELKESKIIIITDVVSTYTTINDIISEYKFDKKNLIALYSILYRSPDTCNFYNDFLNLADKTFTLNNSFSIEIAQKSKCKFLSQCVAHNRIGGYEI